MLTALDKLKAKWNGKKFVCIGLDPDLTKISTSFFEFNKSIIDQTIEVASSYKPQIAYYEELGAEGLRALKETVDYIREKDPGMPIILDAKRADISSTNEAYAKAYFDKLGVDALTVHPYLGQEAIQPFLDREDKLIIVLVRTSNPGAGEFQDLEVNNTPLYLKVAQNVSKNWNAKGNCGIVVGATFPEELKKVREIIGDMPILIPGIGAQGGDLEMAVKNGVNSQGEGIIINSARGIIYAPSPKDAALKLNQDIVNFLS